MLDNREFPELYDVLPRNIAVLTDTIVSFLRAEPEFIQGGFVYVLREFVFPVANWHYSLIPQASELSFSDYLFDHDPDVYEMVREFQERIR